MSGNHRLLVRAVVATAVVLWMQAGPVARQLLGLPRPPGTATWMMYRDRGLDLCAVQWVERLPDGTERPVDRHALYDWPRRGRPTPARLLEGTDEVDRAGRRMCRKLPAGTDLRVHARCGGWDGWTRTHRAERNLCAEAP